MSSTQHRLQVTPDRRFFQYADGALFLYWGHRLTLAEPDRYLTNRRRQRLYG